MSRDEFQTTESPLVRAVKKEFYSTVEESTKRRERRHRASELEASRRMREFQGLKPHFINVSAAGEPYGYRVGV
jgi:hypothetical protein